MCAFSSKSDENCGKYSSGQTHRHTDTQTDAQTGLIPRVKIFSPEKTEYKKVRNGTCVDTQVPDEVAGFAKILSAILANVGLCRAAMTKLNIKP